MRRVRAFAVSTTVALGVFLWFALPLLRDMFGRVVNLPVYAGIALLAGGVTWAVVRDLSADGPTESTGPAGVATRGNLTEETDDETTADTKDGPREPDVETEMEQLREDL